MKLSNTSPCRLPSLLLALAALSLSGLATAQQGQLYELRQQLRAVVPVYGPSANMSAKPDGNLRSRSGDRYAFSIKEAVTRDIHGATLPLAAPYANLNADLELWRTDNTGKPTTKLRTVSFPVSTTRKLHSPRFASPFRIPANTPYAIVIHLPRDGFLLPLTYNGTKVPGYRTLNSVWRPLDLEWIYRVDCGTQSRIPTLSSPATPLIGRTMQFEIANTLPGAPVWLYFGDSNTQLGRFSLPIGLSGIGATGCYVRTSQLFSLYTRADRAGKATLPIPIPNSTGLVGTRFYNQGMIYDQSANRLGLAFTNGGRRQDRQGLHQRPGAERLDPRGLQPAPRQLLRLPRLDLPRHLHRQAPARLLQRQWPTSLHVQRHGHGVRQGRAVLDPDHPSREAPRRHQRQDLLDSRPGPRPARSPARPCSASA